MKKLVLAAAVVAVLVFAAAGGALAEKVFRVGLGDVVFVKQSKTACSVARPFNQMVCFEHDASGRAIVGSYGTSVSGKVAAVVRFNSARKPVVVFRRRQ